MCVCVCARFWTSSNICKAMHVCPYVWAWIRCILTIFRARWCMYARLCVTSYNCCKAVHVCIRTSYYCWEVTHVCAYVCLWKSMLTVMYTGWCIYVCLWTRHLLAVIAGRQSMYCFLCAVMNQAYVHCHCCEAMHLCEFCTCFRSSCMRTCIS